MADAYYIKGTRDHMGSACILRLVCEVFPSNNGTVLIRIKCFERRADRMVNSYQHHDKLVKKKYMVVF